MFADEEGWKPMTDDGFIGHVGPIFVKRDGSGPLYGFLTEGKHRNTRGVVQGGMLMTFADRAMGQSIRDTFGPTPIATIQFDMHFVSRCGIDEVVTTRPKIVRSTASIVFVECELMAGNRTIATAKGLWKRLAARQAS